MHCNENQSTQMLDLILNQRNSGRSTLGSVRPHSTIKLISEMTMRYLNELIEKTMMKVKKARHLKIYPEPDETLIKRDHWTLFAEPAPHDNSEISVTCELCDTFIDASLDDPMIAHAMRADFCKALDDLGMDYTKAERTCVDRSGLTQVYVFRRRTHFG